MAAVAAVADNRAPVEENRLAGRAQVIPIDSLQSVSSIDSRVVLHQERIDSGLATYPITTYRLCVCLCMCVCVCVGGWWWWLSGYVCEPVFLDHTWYKAAT